MAASTARTVEEYLQSLPEPRREVVSRVREVVLRNLPAGYEETMNWGMICYEIPLARYPETYNGQPLAAVALAAQKHHYALYLNCVYGDDAQTGRLAERFAQAGRKLDMGKSCLRFRKLDDLPLEAIGEVVRENTPERYIGRYEASRRR